MFVCPDCGANEWGTCIDRGYCHGNGCVFNWARSPEKDKELGIVTFAPEADTLKLATVPPRKE